MEEKAPPDDRLEPILPDFREPSSVPAFEGLGPASAILLKVFGDRIPTGPLGPATVPSCVLSPAIRLAQKRLSAHLRKCQEPRCSFVPRSLERYKRQRPDAITKPSATELVHKVLWEEPESHFVSHVRAAITVGDKPLADQIRSGAIFQGNTLAEELARLGDDGPRLLATMLWALRFDVPNGKALFRLLVPLVGAAATTKPAMKAAEAPPPSRRDLKNKVAELKEARQQTEAIRKDLAAKERALERAKADLESEREGVQRIRTDLEQLQETLRNSEAARSDLEAAARKATSVQHGLRREIAHSRDELRALELDRSNLSRHLGKANRDIERLRLRLAARPAGLDAVYRFVRTERARLKRDRLIAQGGARQRLDDEWNAFRKLRRAFLNAHPEYRQARPPRRRAKDPLRFVAFGGSGEVGRSCYLVELGAHRILVDCGIKPSGSDDVHADLDQIDHLDALILTHAHADHIGWVPALIRKFPQLPIYCSEGTAALLPIMLDDCRRHYIRKLTAARERAKYSRERPTVPEEYGAEDVVAVRNQVIACEYCTAEAIPPGDITFTFHPAGHVLGAASVLIKGGGRRIFFSGDFSSFPQCTVPAAQWPEDLGEVDLLVLESTYGDKTHKPLDEARRQMVAFLNDVVTNKGGSVVVACFALGRAQEVLSLISAARRNGEIPSTVPVYVDGMIKQLNPIYEEWATFDVLPGELTEVIGEDERQQAIFTAQQRAAIIVTTSGMMNGGPVMEYARQLLPDPRHRILLTGHQDDEAPSRALRELAGGPGPGGPRRVQYTDEDGEQKEFEAALPAEQISLSAHADQPGLLHYAGLLKPTTVALVHGEPQAQQELKSRLEQMYGRNDIVECGPAELDVM